MLDGLLIATGMFFISWTLVLSPVYQHTSGGLAGRDVQPGLPGHRLDPGVAGHHLGHPSFEPQPDEPGPGLGRPAGRAASDSSFSYLTALHRYGIGNATDIGWVLGYFLVALGALWAHDHPVAPDPMPERPNLRALVGPNIPLLGVMVVAVWQVGVHHVLDRMSQISFMAVIMAMSARQFLVLLEHFNLSHQLETKVEERTLELQHQAYHDGLTGSPTGHCSTAIWTRPSRGAAAPAPGWSCY